MDPSEEIREQLDEARRAANRRDFAEGLKACGRALELDPDHVGALDLMGFLHYFSGEPDRAEQCCRRSIALQPGRAYPLKGLGICLAAQGHVPEGIEMLKQAIAAEPKYVDPYHDLAVVYYRSGDLENARVHFEKAIALDPNLKPRLARVLAEIEAKIAARKG